MRLDLVVDKLKRSLWQPNIIRVLLIGLHFVTGCRQCWNIRRKSGINLTIKQQPWATIFSLKIWSSTHQSDFSRMSLPTEKANLVNILQVSTMQYDFWHSYQSANEWTFPEIISGDIKYGWVNIVKLAKDDNAQTWCYTVKACHKCWYDFFFWNIDLWIVLIISRYFLILDQ